MSERFLVHLPDGKEYGPIDRATLEKWWAEGRLAEQTLVWPHGAPEWLTLSAALASGGAAARADPTAHAVPEAPAVSEARVKLAARPTSAMAQPAPKARPSAGPRPVAPTKASADAQPSPTAQASPKARPDDDGPDTKPPMPAPSSLRPSASGKGGANPERTRILLVTAAAATLVLALVAGLGALLRPFLARSVALVQVQRYALREAHLEDSDAGLVVDLPAGWVALRAGNPFLPEPEARLRLAQPSIGAFATLVVAAHPRSMDALDAYLDELLQRQLPRRPSLRKGDRAEVQLGRGRGRLVHTTWQDAFTPMQGATVVWADGYAVFSLDAWSPASVGQGFTEQVEALCGGLRSTGLLEARLREATNRLELEVPELPPDVLRLLVGERLSQGGGLDDVPREALRVVSRGLEALEPAEAAEMRTIYQQVWAPLGEADRVHMARLLSEIRAGRELPAVEIQVLRDTVKGGVLSLPGEQRSRLQQLSARAARKALAKP